MTCDRCGGKTKKRRVRKHHTFKKRLYVVENATAEVCQECGARYCHAKTLDEIDKVLSGANQVRETLRVEVVPL